MPTNVFRALEKFLTKEQLSVVVEETSKAKQKEMTSTRFRTVETVPNADAWFFHNTYEELKEKLLAHELESVRWMTKQVDEENELYQFLHSVMMLDKVRRWKGKFNTVPDNDATHIFRATALSIFNAHLETIKYRKEMDILSIVAKTLCHDIVEERTGDVLGPVKHSTPEMKKAFEEYERDMAIEMTKLLPEIIRPEFVEYMANSKSNDYEGAMVDIADKVDALIKTNMERHNGQVSYEIDFRKQLKKIQAKYKNPCVEFFLMYILHDMDFPMFDDITD
jgi:putative hydrolase of HD superfamily